MDYTISVTDPNRRRPVMEQIEGLGNDARTSIGPGEDAILASHRPAKWHREHDYVVVRRMETDKDGNPKWVRSVILVSRADPPLEELVRRRRSKQGQKNFFKGC